MMSRLVSCVISLIITLYFVSFSYASGDASTNGHTAVSDATTTMHACEKTTIHLPDEINPSDVDGVVIEFNNRAVPIEYFLESSLNIIPCKNFEPGGAYTIKLFMKNGNRHIIQSEVEQFIKFNKTDENTVWMPAKPSKGFNYGYSLFIPKDLDYSNCRLLINCLNTIPKSDQEYFDRQTEIQSSLNTVTYLARELKIPCLVPAFPRIPGDNNVPGYFYPQMLDAAAVQGEKTDLQLLAIIEDAKQEMAYNGINIADKIFIFGFSTDAKFAQRFTILHPDVVMATVAGGISGLATFPIAEYKGEKLRYPIGIANLKELTGSEFDKEEYLKIPQFFFMGEIDHNDPTEYRDCFKQEEAEQIWRLLGRQQVPDRWSATQRLLKDIAPNIECKTYANVGHSPRDAHKDMISFFKEHQSRKTGLNCMKDEHQSSTR